MIKTPDPVLEPEISLLFICIAIWKKGGNIGCQLNKIVQCLGASPLTGPRAKFVCVLHMEILSSCLYILFFSMKTWIAYCSIERYVESLF